MSISVPDSNPGKLLSQHCHIHTCELQKEKVWSEPGNSEAVATANRITRRVRPEVRLNPESQAIGTGAKIRCG